jgi:hypothetical protein
MPPQRTKEDEEEYVSNIHSTNTAIISSRSVRNRTRGSASISTMQEIFPFPIGLPTEPVHHAIVSFSAQSLPYMDLGTVDNLACWLYFSSKRYKDNIWSLRIIGFPARHDFTPLMRRKLRLPLQRVVDTLGDVPYDQWKNVVESAIVSTIELTQNVDDQFRDTLASEGFLQQVYLTLVPLESQLDPGIDASFVISCSR